MNHSSIVNKIFFRLIALTNVLISPILLTPTFVGAAGITDVGHSTSEAHLRVAQTDRWTTQVYAQLLTLAVAAGFTKDDITHKPFIGDLGHESYEDITVNLRKGVTYVIVGVCDEDCSDFDLRLYDENGNLIAKDTKRDSTPVVAVTPSWNARFTVRSIMVRCSNAPCRYGIGFFGR